MACIVRDEIEPSDDVLSTWLLNHQAPTDCQQRRFMHAARWGLHRVRVSHFADVLKSMALFSLCSKAVALWRCV